MGRLAGEDPHERVGGCGLESTSRNKPGVEGRVRVERGVDETAGQEGFGSQVWHVMLISNVAPVLVCML